MSSAIKSDACDELMHQIEKKSVRWTSSGDTDLPNPTQRLGGGSPINSRTMQQKAIEKALELLGDEAWDYGYKSGIRHNQKPLRS